MYGMGIDIVKVSRLARWEDDREALDYVFTKKEWASALDMKHASRHLAAVFAVKEAFMKAIGTGWGEGVQQKDIEVFNDNGRITVRLHNRAKELCGGRKVFASTGCESTLAVSLVVISDCA